MSFETSIEFIKPIEGGYSNNPNDPGGETNFGISKRSYPNLDIKNLTWEQAKAIYKRDFWDKMHCSELPESVAHLVLDFGINSGPVASIKILQKALNTLGSSLVVDGAIGPRTISAVASQSTKDICDEMLSARIMFYANLIVKNPKMLEDLVGWLNRVEKDRKFIKGSC